MSTTKVDGDGSISSTTKFKDIAITLPFSPHTVLHIRLALLASSSLIFLTTTDVTGEGAAASSALGSFVYSMPNRFEPANPLCTQLSTVPSTIELATRIAKVVARRTSQPIYVGCSVNFADASIEEELDGFKLIVAQILQAMEIAKTALNQQK